MRVLLVIPHFFKAIEKSPHSSNHLGQLEHRKKSLDKLLMSWRAQYCETATINIPDKNFHIQRSLIQTLDIVILTNGSNHLLDKSTLDLYQCRQVNVECVNPKMLPFGSYQIFKRELEAYDWFVYSEDDLLLTDSLFFIKQKIFQDEFGFKRLLQPNRFELNVRGPRFKTYIDGDQSDIFFNSSIKDLPDQDLLFQNLNSYQMKYRRARNPHSGFFCLSKEQLTYWISKDYFLNLDCSFVSPLESAATLGILRTFSIYKPESNRGFLEIEHLDDKFSSLPLKIAEK
jgi:hypothetical protein